MQGKLTLQDLHTKVLNLSELGYFDSINREELLVADFASDDEEIIVQSLHCD